MMQKSETIISRAPGKVLICGGYGVLEEGNFGLSLALNSQFYCLCQSYTTSGPTKISVNSPQISQSWCYISSSNELKQVENKKNVFVENAILWALRYFQRESNAGTVRLEIIFDRNFISNADAIGESKYPLYKQGYKKTGLGSSACVLVSIVKCLVEIYGHQIEDKGRVVNVISQLANLSAQNKIGSNFDISTAVYGSHLYKNVLPHQIFSVLQDYSHQRLSQLLLIDSEIQIIQSFPVSLHGYIVDINKGADTRLMVSGFLSELRKKQAEVQEQFFNQSKSITLELFDTLTKGGQECRQINERHRKLQRKYSKLTGVPIEPEDLTPLIDGILEVEGTLYAICPGSGGYDAIFVLTQKELKQQITNVAKGHGIRQVELCFEANEDISPQKRNQLISALKEMK